MAGRSRATCCCHSRAVSGCMLCLLAGEVIGVSTLPTTPLSDTPLLPHPTQIARRSHADAHAHRQMPTHIEGPPVHVRRNPPLPADGAAGLPEALIRLWTDVSNAGGAVGFVAPVALDDVRAVAEAAFARVRSGADDLVVAYEDGRPVARLRRRRRGRRPPTAHGRRRLRPPHARRPGRRAPRSQRRRPRCSRPSTA